MMLKKLFLFLCLLISGISGAQDIDNNDLSFTYTKLPLTPLRIASRNYQSNVVQKFVDIIKTKTDAYNQAVINSNAEYQKATDAQALLQKLEDEKYSNAMNAWNKKTKADQQLNAAQFPQRTIIPMPSYREVPKPDLPKTYDEKILAGSLKLEGFTNSNVNPVIITASLFGFNSENPILQERTIHVSAVASGTNTGKSEIKKYYYLVKYKHPMAYKLEVIEQNTVSEQTLPELDRYLEFKTAEYDSIAILERNWAATKANTLNQLQDKTVADNLNYINNVINDKYGYVKVKHNTLLSTVDEKKDYQDYKEAYVAAENGYKIIAENKPGAFAELDKAIALWENAMKESDPNNKKARVDGDVTEVTILNLIEAYIWKDDYAKAKAYIDKIKTLDPSRKAKRRIEQYELLYQNNKTRFDANQ